MEKIQMKQEKTRGQGRPKAEINLDQVEKLAALGLPLHHIANIIDVSKSTLDKHINENEEVFRAISKGRSSASKKIYETAYNLAIGGNVTMLIFWLKCRERWKEEDPTVEKAEEETLTPENLAKVREAARKYLEIN